MWGDDISNASKIIARVGENTKIVFNPPSMICMMCNTMPFEQDQHGRFCLQWAIENKICHHCEDKFNNDYEQVKDNLSLEEYIQTIELANELIK